MRLWNSDGDLQTTLDGHAGGISALAIAPDSSWLATGDHSATVRIWNGRGRLLATYDIGIGIGWISAPAISPDGTWPAAGYGSRVMILDPGGIPIALLHPGDGEVTTLVISPDGSWLAMGDERGAVHVLDSHFTALPSAFTLPSGCRCLAISPDSSWFAAGSDAGQIHIQDRDGHVRGAIFGHGRHASHPGSPGSGP
ncbi:hypothetical protein AB0L65_58210 [Nonomuraea sp. NPDC052116]|uniref:WD40 repeat domain-containing protein n=1 Tax=Nonomuraea sp. NPDC052116 TaxID=3155665 RepID=UPI003428E1F8